MSGTVEGLSGALCDAASVAFFFLIYFWIFCQVGERVFRWPVCFSALCTLWIVDASAPACSSCAASDFAGRIQINLFAFTHHSAIPIGIESVSESCIGAEITPYKYSAHVFPCARTHARRAPLACLAPLITRRTASDLPCPTQPP